MILRDLEAVEHSSHDLIVVGGGVYGVALTLEAARRGLKPLLVERWDFGGQTSWNSLRIVHGGIRYLQTLDLKRFRESVVERRWWLRHFSDLVEPLPCLMPLYGRGLRRPAIFRLALGAEDLLSRDRNRGVRPDRKLARGRIVDVGELLRLYPRVDRRDLVGGALWNDAAMPDSHRLLIEMLHWATSCGAVALNYVEATRLVVDGKSVAGLEVRDTESGSSRILRAPIVVNCAGPWCRQVAAAFDRDIPELFRPSVAFNVLLDRAPLFDGAVAVEPPVPGGRTYFLHRWKGRILAGTYHSHWSKTFGPGTIEEELVPSLVDDLNAAIPGFDLRCNEIQRIHWGLLPARSIGSEDPANRAMIHHHADTGGPQGLFSVSGVKFTTSRRVAEKTLERVCRWRGDRLPGLAAVIRPATRPPKSWRDFESLLSEQKPVAQRHLRRLVEEESALHLDDLMFRRTDWGVDPRETGSRAHMVAGLMGWDGGRVAEELRAFRGHAASPSALPATFPGES